MGASQRELVHMYGNRQMIPHIKLHHNALCSMWQVEQHE